MQLPQRLGWDGAQFESGFSDLKVTMNGLDEDFLPRVLQMVSAQSKSQPAKEA